MSTNLPDLRKSELDGRVAEDRLAQTGITANRNAVPFDPRPPMVSSGLRLGMAALATRGFEVEDFSELGQLIRALGPRFEAERDSLAERCADLARRYPLYPDLVAMTSAGAAYDDLHLCY